MKNTVEATPIGEIREIREIMAARGRQISELVKENKVLKESVARLAKLSGEMGAYIHERASEDYANSR